MVDIHCHSCGGFISDPGPTAYRLPPNPAHLAIPHSGLCPCTPPIVYGPAPGMPSADHRSTRPP